MINIKSHLIPPIIQDKGEFLLNEHNNQVARENYAIQLEEIIKYCQDVLTRYEKQMGFRRHR